MLKYKYVNGCKKHIQKMPWEWRRLLCGDVTEYTTAKTTTFSVHINQIQAFFLRTGIPITRTKFYINSIVSLPEVN